MVAFDLSAASSLVNSKMHMNAHSPRARPLAEEEIAALRTDMAEASTVMREKLARLKAERGKGELRSRPLIAVQAPTSSATAAVSKSKRS